MFVDEQYMQRALDLARKGLFHASPNPMVGALIVGEGGRILGEGYHRRCGEGHAEVNAIAQVKDEKLLKNSTMYVTLEPCAHYGRTGPCAELIVKKGIPRVVVATRDPFVKVNGKGIEIMKNAGVEVVEGVLGDEARKLNAIFFTAHMLRRPFILLKWAKTADGYMDIKRCGGDEPLSISTPLTKALSHRLRSIFDAILVGSGTVLADNPSLDTRLWAGDSPVPVVLDRRGRVTHDMRMMSRTPLLISDDKPLADIMGDLYEKGITSVIVEGGRQVLNSFINENLWDVIRVETAPLEVGDKGSTPAPVIFGIEPSKVYDYDGQIVKYYVQNALIDVKNL